MLCCEPARVRHGPCDRGATSPTTSGIATCWRLLFRITSEPRLLAQSSHKNLVPGCTAERRGGESDLANSPASPPPSQLPPGAVAAASSGAPASSDRKVSSSSNDKGPAAAISRAASAVCLAAQKIARPDRIAHNLTFSPDSANLALAP
jgi:hypothetical protein